MSISGSKVTARRVTGHVEGNVLGSVGSIFNLVKFCQVITVTVGTTGAGTAYTASLPQTINTAKSLLIPLSFATIQANSVLGQWDWNGSSGIKVHLEQVAGTQPTATAKALVMEFW